jgi:hypothetical protein
LSFGLLFTQHPAPSTQHPAPSTQHQVFPFSLQPLTFNLSFSLKLFFKLLQIIP